MSIEQLRTDKILNEAKPRNRFLDRTTSVGKDVVRWFSENAAISADREFHPDFTKDIIKATEDGFVQAWLGSHTAWFDAILLSYVSRIGIGIANEHLSEDKKIEGAAMAFAITMLTAKQGKVLDFMFQADLPILTNNKVYPVYTSTDNDQQKRGETNNSRDFTADMMSMMRSGFTALASLPEASVQGGRKNKEGKRHGMQLFREGTVASAILLAKRLRRPGVLFIPVGIEGGWKINNPHGKFPTLEGWKAGLLMNRGVCKVIVGKPIRSDIPEIHSHAKQKNYQELDNILGFAIADLISKDMRGVYTNRETLEKAIRESRRTTTSL